VSSQFPLLPPKSLDLPRCPPLIRWVPERAQVPERARARVSESVPERVLEWVPEQARVPEQALESARVLESALEQARVPGQVPG
jgi:hypothetical protein